MSMTFRRIFFFFKQKTAYEMRISDWSSDVCSSDLVGCQTQPGDGCARPLAPAGHCPPSSRACGWRGSGREQPTSSQWGRTASSAGTIGNGAASRSEEHTSELQSLMRISYAVFCLTKKKNQ